MTKMIQRINPTILIKEVDLDTSRIYSRNQMVEMDKSFFNVMHQRKSKQGLHYKTTTMRNTMYAQAKKKPRIHRSKL
jgi:hypothetical protein